MKHIPSLHASLAVLCLAAPVSGLGAPHERDEPVGRHSGFHGRFFHRGPRFYYGTAPIFWGPAIGFSFYGSPGYYSPGSSYDDGADRPTSRGIPRAEADARGDDLGVEVQRSLAQHGYYRGAVDGEIGPGSRAAVRAYQSDHGLEPTGRIDNTLLRSLHIE